MQLFSRPSHDGSKCVQLPQMRDPVVTFVTTAGHSGLLASESSTNTPAFSPFRRTPFTKSPIRSRRAPITTEFQYGCVALSKRQKPSPCFIVM